MIEMELRPIIKTINYDNLGVTSRDGSTMSRFVSMFIFTSLLMILVVSFVFIYLWWLTLATMIIYLFGAMGMMAHYSKRLRAPGFFSRSGHPTGLAESFPTRGPAPMPHVKEEDDAHRDFMRTHHSHEEGKQKKKW